jgi:hypothetical protein
MQIWFNQGRHRYYVEADLVFFELHGLVTLEDSKCLLSRMYERVQECGYCLTVFDARDGLFMDAEARRYSSVMLDKQEIMGINLIVGAGAATRAVTRLMQNASALLGKKRAPVEFCSTLDGVPAWLAEKRRHFQEKGTRKVQGTE